MPIVNTGRFDINYIEEGDGFPVVLIHGLAGDHTAWLPQVVALKDDYRVIAFDNPGSGDSSTVDDPATTADLADATLALMDRLGIERAHVIGRSMGGRRRPAYGVESAGSAAVDGHGSVVRAP